MRITTVHVVADRKSLSASELRRIARRREKITKPPHGLNHVHAEFLADAPNKDFYSVRVAVECLVIEVLDEFAPGDHTPGMVHQVGKQPILMRGKFDRIAIDADPASAGVEAN